MTHTGRSCRTAALAAVLVLASCGIEDYDYLYPPTELSSGTTIIIKHNIQNMEANAFLGYQFYYKIYQGDSASTPPTAANTDAATIESNWTSVYPDVVVKRMTDAGYVKMASSKDLSSSVVTTLKADPFFDISSGELAKSVTATLYLGTGTWDKTVDNSTTNTYYLRRQATSASSEHLSFTDLEYSSTDCDSTNPSGSRFWIRIYAVAYGVNSNWTPLYGTPVRATSSGYSYDTLYLGP
jgi:hypothetical protein